jgi:DNA-binding transcriptional LysR family regulator
MRLAVSRASSPIFCSRAAAPHTLLALAEGGRGVAIIPSLLRTDRYTLRIVRVMHERKPLREPLVIHWDKRRPLPPYAESFCEALAEYMGEILPITRPSAGKTSGARGIAAAGKRRGRANRPPALAGYR